MNPRIVFGFIEKRRIGELPFTDNLASDDNPRNEGVILSVLSGRASPDHSTRGHVKTSLWLSLTCVAPSQDRLVSPKAILAAAPRLPCKNSFAMGP